MIHAPKYVPLTEGDAEEDGDGELERLTVIDGVVDADTVGNAVEEPEAVGVGKGDVETGHRNNDEGSCDN